MELALNAKCLQGNTFTFNGKSSEMYGLMMCWRSNPEEWDTGLNREIVKTEMSMSRHIPNQYGVKYTDVLKMEFDIFHYDGSPFDYRESREINKWLMQESYKPFKVHDNNVDNIYYNVICTEIHDIVMGTFCGKAITMTCDSPFGYTSARNKVLSATPEKEAVCKMNNTSDDGNYYPCVTLTCPGTYQDYVELTNVTEDKSMLIDMTDIKVSDSKKILKIDGKRMMLLDADDIPVPLYKIGWTIPNDDSQAIQTAAFYWFKLLPGLNEVHLTGNVNATFRLSFPRKAGQIDEQQVISM